MTQGGWKHGDRVGQCVWTRTGLTNNHKLLTYTGEGNIILVSRCISSYCLLLLLLLTSHYCPVTIIITAKQWLYAYSDTHLPSHSHY